MGLQGGGMQRAVCRTKTSETDSQGLGGLPRSAALFLMVALAAVVLTHRDRAQSLP